MDLKREFAYNLCQPYFSVTQNFELAKMVVEIATCGKYSSGFMKPGTVFNFGKDFQSTMESPRKTKMIRTRSFEEWNRISKIGLRRTCSACFDRKNNDNNYNDSSVEGYRKNLREFALQSYAVDEELEVVKTELGFEKGSVFKREVNETNLGFRMWGPSKFISNHSISWPGTLGNKGGDSILPLSLKVLKRELNKDKEMNKITGNSTEAKQPDCCQYSVGRAFSSMVFMMWELQAHSLQIREILLHEDLHELLEMVQIEMQSSFAWIFQQVFSCTPALMVSIMILLANFTVYSMGNNVAMAATLPIGSTTSNKKAQCQHKFIEENPSWTKASNQSSLPVVVNIDMPNALSEGLDGGERRNLATVVDGNSHDSEGNFLENHIMNVGDNLVKPSVSSLQNQVSGRESKARNLGSDVEEAEKENQNPADQIESDILLWQSFLKDFESNSMGYIGPDPGTIKSLVPPITAQLEPDNYICYDRTELLYQNAISTDPNNALLLSNYARFLHLVRHDHDRAEEYFKLAVQSYSVDGEAIVQFANFLWLARGDLPAAEKSYLDAINVEPWNPFHAATYAHFLWHTGGADSSSCYSDNPTISSAEC